MPTFSELTIEPISRAQSLGVAAESRSTAEAQRALQKSHQEERAARLLADRGHVAQGLRLTLSALDSAVHAAQLVSGRNEPARAITGVFCPRAHARASTGSDDAARVLEVLRRARTLSVPSLDDEVDADMHALGAQAREVTRILLRLLARDVWLARGSARFDARASRGSAATSFLRRLLARAFGSRPRLPQ
jgi:hypothetical protein